MLILIVLLTLEIALLRGVRYGFWDWADDCALGAWLCGITLGLAVTIIPLSRMGDRMFIARVEAMRSTVAQSNWQDAAWRTKAAETNAQIASRKYYLNSVFGLWAAPEIAKLEPLQ